MGYRSVADIRNSWGPAWADASDEAIIGAYSKAAKVDPLFVANTLGYDPGTGSLTKERLSSSVDNYQAGLYGLAEAVTGSDWARKRRQDNEFQANIASARAKELGGIDSYKDVTGPVSAANYVGGLAAQSFPYLGEAMLGGMLTRGVSTGLRAAGSVAREMGMTAAEKQVAKEMAVRSGIGGAVASYPSSVGDILGNQREQLREQGLDDRNVDVLSAGIGGFPYAAANYFSPAERLVSGQGMPRIASALDKGTGVTAGMKRMGANAAILGTGEGLNELGQEFVNQRFGRMAVDPNETFWNDKSKDRFAESFVGGAALGGVLGGGAGGWRRTEKGQQEFDARQRAQAATLEQDKPADLLTTSQGFEDLIKPRAATVNPLGDLTPDWTTAPGAQDAATYENAIEPTGLYRAVGDSAPNTGINPLGMQLQMPTVPGRPGMADMMLSGPTSEIAATDPDNVAMQDPGTQEAIRRFTEQRAQQQAKEQADAEAKATAEQAAQYRETLKQQAAVVGLDPKKGAHVEIMRDLMVAETNGLISKADVAAQAGLVAAGESPGKVRGRLNTISEAIQMEQTGEVPPGTVQKVRNDVSAGGDGKTLLKDAKKLAAGKAAMETTTSNKPVQQAKPANVINAEAPAPNAGTTATAAAPATVAPANPVARETVPVQPAAKAEPEPVVSAPAAVPAVEGRGDPTVPVVVKKVRRATKDGALGEAPAPAVSKNTVFTEEGLEARRKARLARKGGTGITELNSGIPITPEDIADIGYEVGYWVERGARTLKAVLEKVLPQFSPTHAKTIREAYNQQMRRQGYDPSPVVAGMIDYAKLNDVLSDRPDTLRAVRAIIGVDDDGHRTGAMPYAAAAQMVGMKASSGTNLSTIMSKELGISKEVLSRAQLSTETVAPLPTNTIVQEGPTLEQVLDEPAAKPRMREEDDVRVQEKFDDRGVRLSEEEVTGDKGKRDDALDANSDGSRKNSASSVGGSANSTDANRKGVMVNQSWFPEHFKPAKDATGEDGKKLKPEQREALTVELTKRHIGELTHADFAKIAVASIKFTDERNAPIGLILIADLQRRLESDKPGISAAIYKAEKEAAKKEAKNERTPKTKLGGETVGEDAVDMEGGALAEEQSIADEGPEWDTETVIEEGPKSERALAKEAREAAAAAKAVADRNDTVTIDVFDPIKGTTEPMVLGNRAIALKRVKDKLTMFQMLVDCFKAG